MIGSMCKEEQDRLELISNFETPTLALVVLSEYECSTPHEKHTQVLELHQKDKVFVPRHLFWV